MAKSAQDRLLQNAWKHADWSEEDFLAPQQKTPLAWWFKYVIALSLAILLIVGWSVARAERPEGVAVDPDTAKWFQSLLVPAGPKEGWGCCNLSDCRTTKVRTVGDHYQAFIKKGTKRDVDAYSDGDDQWHDVPNEHLLRNTPNMVGEPVACYFQGEVLCLVLASLT